MSSAVLSGAATGRVGAAALRLGVATLCAALLAGCGNDKSLSDLDSYVREVKARPGKRPDPLPPVKAYVNYGYGAPETVDPFKSFLDLEAARARAEETQVEDGGITPDFDRNSEELENFALDSLRMMGTLEQQGEVWAIVRSPDAILHRVQPGNYLGQNFGRVTTITDEALALVEIVRDERGRWAEREAALSLVQ